MAPHFVCAALRIIIEKTTTPPVDFPSEDRRVDCHNLPAYELHGVRVGMKLAQFNSGGNSRKGISRIIDRSGEDKGEEDKGTSRKRIRGHPEFIHSPPRSAARCPFASASRTQGEFQAQ